MVIFKTSAVSARGKKSRDGAYDLIPPLHFCRPTSMLRDCAAFSARGRPVSLYLAGSFPFVNFIEHCFSVTLVVLF